MYDIQLVVTYTPISTSISALNSRPLFIMLYYSESNYSPASRLIYQLSARDCGLWHELLLSLSLSPWFFRGPINKRLE